MNQEVQSQEVLSTAKQNSATPYVVAAQPKKEDTERTKRLKSQFGFFGPATFLYAAFYAFCMFRNGSGITFPFFVAGSLLYLCLCLSKLEISLKKGSVFYMTGMMLLAVSTFCTDDYKIINLNKTGIFLLMMSLLLKQFYETANWKLGKYLSAILQLIFSSLGEVGRPFTDGAAYLRGRKKDSKIWFAVLGLAVGLPLLLFAASLLSSADAVFRQMTKDFFDWLRPAYIWNVVFRVVFLFFASYLLLAYLCRHSIREEVKDHRKGEPVLAITVTGLLSLLYILFSGIQIFGLFLGRMQLPEGYTYAEYAREGFFQLLFVSIMNLVIVLCTMSFFRKSRLLQVILTVMSLCTFVMIASSAMRMILYISTYDLTFLRIFVLWTLTVLFVLFGGVIAGIFWEGFPLFRFSVAVVTVCYVALSFSHPDYMIAKVNLADAHRSAEQEAADARDGIYDGGYTNAYGVDFSYLASLSADAAPVLIPYMKELGYDLELYETEETVWHASGLEAEDRYKAQGFGYVYLDRLRQKLEEDSLRTFNISRHMARVQLERYG